VTEPRTVYIDPLQRYDWAIVNWLKDEMVPLLPKEDGTPMASPADVAIVFATPERRYVDVFDGEIPSSDMLKVPRIAVMRMDPVYDPSREQSAPIRTRLGYPPGEDPDRPRKSYRMKYPAPYNLMYQVSFWTSKVWHMNIWTTEVMLQWKLDYRVFQIDTGLEQVGVQRYHVFMEALRNASDLEPQEGDRVIRYDIDLRCEAWIFPRAVEEQHLVHTITHEVVDQTTDEVVQVTKRGV
jgi:hypothetical protein